MTCNRKAAIFICCLQGIGCTQPDHFWVYNCDMLKAAFTEVDGWQCGMAPARIPRADAIRFFGAAYFVKTPGMFRCVKEGRHRHGARTTKRAYAANSKFA